MIEWRPTDWPGYDVSSDGQIRSPHGRILSQHSDGSYLTVQIAGLDGVRRPRRVHMLVAEAFLGPRPSGAGRGGLLEIRHLDDDKTNNAVTNLVYGTRSENMLDRTRNGIHHEANKTHCKNGHEFTPETTYLYDGRRICKVCKTASRKQARERRSHGYIVREEP